MASVVSVQITVYCMCLFGDWRDVVCVFSEKVVEKDKKRSRRVSCAWQSTKLRAMEGHQSSPPLSQRKGEGNRLVLLAAGPAVSIFVEWYVFLRIMEFFLLTVR